MNWLEVQQLLESMQKNMDCPICLEIMKNPVTTVCNHNFCNFCISKFLNTKRYVPCPMCKILLSKRSLRENSKLRNIIDKVKKLVSAIETDTGRTYTPPTRKQTLQVRRRRQKANSVKRKISLEDNTELLDETNTKNTRFGKRRKSTDPNDKDKDSVCNDSPSSGLTSLDAHNPSNELNLVLCSLDRPEALGSVTPPAVLYRRERKNKSKNKEDSLGKELEPSAVPSRNLRSALRRSSDVDVKSQKLEASVDLGQQIVHTDSLNTDTLSPIASTSGIAVSHRKENSRSAISSDCEKDPAVEVSRAENLVGRYNPRSPRCSTDNIVASKELSGSSQRLATKEPSDSTQKLGTKELPGCNQRPQTQKPETVLKNLENLSEAIESPRELGCHTLLDSISQDCHKNIDNTAISPMKTRNRIKCQQSYDKVASSKTCVVFGEMLKKHATDSGSRKIVRVELRKKKELAPETNTKPCSKKCKPQQTDSDVDRKCSVYPKIENLPKMKISQITKRNRPDLSSQSTLNDGVCKNRFVVDADLKKTETETDPIDTSRKLENNPLDRSVNDADEIFGKGIPYSVLVWSSDSEDDMVNIGKQTESPSFKWSVETDELKTYSRKCGSETRKNRAKIARWLRLLPSKFSKVDADSTRDEDADSSVYWLPLSQRDEEVGKPDSRRESKTDLQNEQNSVEGSSVNSGPDFSVSQLENDSSVVGKEEMAKCWKKMSSMKWSEDVHKTDGVNVSGNELEEKNSVSPQFSHTIGLVNVSVNALEEKNSVSPQCDQEDDSFRISAEEELLKIPDILERTLGTSENNSVCGTTPKEAKRKGSFAEPRDTVDGESLVENLNPYEFIESPNVTKQQKKKKTRKSSSKMPELSFQNRLTRSFQKRLSFKNSATDVSPSASGHHEQQVTQVGIQDKILTRREPVAKEPGTQMTLRNYSPSCPQEKSFEHLTPKKSSKKEKASGIPYNAKQDHGSSFPDEDNPTSSRSSENSLECKKPVAVVPVVCKVFKERAISEEDCELDVQNSDTHKTSKTRKQMMEKPPDMEFVEPVALGNNWKKSGQRRRSRRPSKVDDKISEELEIMELVNQISSAEEHDFLFNSQDVCHSFDVSIDNQAVNNTDRNTGCDESYDTCNRLNDGLVESDNAIQSVTGTIKDKIGDEDSTMIQNSSNRKQVMIIDPCKNKDTNIISRTSIDYTCENIEETEESSSKTAGKKNSHGNDNIRAAGTSENVSTNKLTLERGQKTRSRSQLDKDNETEDKFVKPANIRTWRRSKRSEVGSNLSKKGVQVSASSSPTNVERSKLVDVETKTSVSSARNSLQKENAEITLEAPPSLRNSQSKQCRTIDTVPSVVYPEKSGNRIEANKQTVNKANLSAKKSESANSELEKCPKTVTIDGKIYEMIKLAPLSHFQKQSRNGQKSDQCIDQPRTPVVNADNVDLDLISELNPQESINVPPASKNTRVCHTEVPITPTVIPESPFSEVATPSPRKVVKETPTLQPTEQRNKIVRFSDQVSFIYSPKKFEGGEDGKGMNPGVPSIGNVRNLQNFGSADLEKGSCNLRECDGDELITDDLKSEHSAIGSRLDGISDFGDKHSALYMSNRQEQNDCVSQVSEVQEGPAIKVGENENHDEKEVEEFDEDTVEISQAAELKFRPKSNLRFCEPTVMDNSELSCEESVSVHSQPIGSGSQRWMNEDLLPLAEKMPNEILDPSTLNEILEPSKAAAITRRKDVDPVIHGDRNSYPASQRTPSVKMGKVDPSVQNQGEETLKFATCQPVAHPPGNYHHLNDDHQFGDEGDAIAETSSNKNDNLIFLDEESHSSGTEDPNINPDLSESEPPNPVDHQFRGGGTSADTSSNKNDNLMELDEESDGHSSGTEDLNINPDPSEFEPPNLAIQPETVKKLLSDTRIMNLIKNGSPRFNVSATEPGPTNEDPKVPADCVDQNIINIEPLIQDSEKFPMSTRSKTSIGAKLTTPSPDLRCIKTCLGKKSSVKKRAKLPSPSGLENAENLILDCESSAGSEQRVSRESSEVSSDFSSPKRNLGSEDEKPPESSSSPCQILCYSSEDTIKESPKKKELPPKPRELESPISKASDSKVQVLPNVRLVDYDISQSSYLSETDSDSVPFFTKLIGRRTRSSSRLQNQSPRSPKTCKLERRKSSQKSKSYSNSPKDSKQDPAVHSEYSADEILPPTAEKELPALEKPDSLISTESSWITVLNSSGSMTQGETDDGALEELFLPKSSNAGKSVKDLTITEGENFLSTAERDFLRSGSCGAEEVSQNMKVKDHCARKETNATAISSERNTEASADCLSGNSESLDFGKVPKSSLLGVNSLAPTLSQSSENTVEEADVSSKGKIKALVKCLPGNSEFLASGTVARSASKDLNSLAPTLTQSSENLVEDEAISAIRNTDALAKCLPENSDFLDSGKVAKSPTQDVNSLAPTQTKSSENVLAEDSLNGKTLKPSQLSNPNPLKSENPPNLVFENQDNGAISKKGSVLPSETGKNDSSTVDIPDSEMIEIDPPRVNIPDTELVDIEPVMSWTDFVIPDSAEPIPATQNELQNDNIPKSLTSNQSISQDSSSSYIPCSVEQDGTLAHVLGAFHDIYTQNHNTTLSEKVCDRAGSNSKDGIKRTTNDIPENFEKKSMRSMSLITEDAVEGISVPHRVEDKRCTGGETILKFDNIIDNPPEVENEVIMKSPLFSDFASTSSSGILNTSKIAFSTECHLMIDSQNFIPVKRSKRKCFSLGNSVLESPRKTSEENKTAESFASSAVTLASTADVKSLDVKSGCKSPSLAPTFTENSRQARENSLSRLDEIEKDENGKLQKASRISPKDNCASEESNSSESCVLLLASQIAELAQAITQDEISVCSPKQNHQILDEKQGYPPGLAPDVPSVGLVSKQTRSRKKFSKTPNLAGSTLTNLSSKLGNEIGDSNSCTEKPANSQQYVSSCDSPNENYGVRSSPRLRARNKASAKRQDEKISLVRAKQESVSSEHQELRRKSLFKNPDSSKDEPEPSHLSSSGSETQQPSCPFSSTEDMEVDNVVVCPLPDDDDDTAVTLEPSLDFSELDKITYSPQGQFVEPMLGLESDQPEPKEFPKSKRSNFDCEESVEKEDAKDEGAENVLELSNRKEDQSLKDSENGSLSSASTKCPSGFSDNSASAPGSQAVLSNPPNPETVEGDKSKNIRQESKRKRGQEVNSQAERMEILGSKATDPDVSANVTEKRVNEKSVGDGVAMAENSKQLTTESENGQCQVKDDLLGDDIDLSLPDIPSSFPQGFQPATNPDEGQNSVSVQLEHPKEVSKTAEASADEKISEDKDLESNSAEGRSQERRGRLRKIQISNSDTKQANSRAVNEDAVIVIDEVSCREKKATEMEVLDCDVPIASAESKDPKIIAQAEAEQSMASAGNPVDENLGDKSDLTGGQLSADGEKDDSEEISWQRSKKPKCQVINDDSDDDDEKVEIINPESVSATSPSTLSTQSEKFSTQQCTHLEQDLEEMKKQIAQLEARLGLNDSTVNSVIEEEEDVELQEVEEGEKLLTVTEQELPPEADHKMSKKVTKGQACDQKYIRLSSSDDDDDYLEKKVIPDSDPDEKDVEPNTSSIFPIGKVVATAIDLHSSGEESEDLFCTPGSPVSLPRLPVLPSSRNKRPEKTAELSPTNKNQDKHLEAKRKRSRKNGTNKSSRLRIESSSSEEEDIEVAVEEDPRSKVLCSKAQTKENKQIRTSGIFENKKEDSVKNSEESPCASGKNSPRSPRKHPKTLPKVKPTPQNESSSPVLKELSVTNTTEKKGRSQPRSSQSPAGCQGKDSQQKKMKCFIATGLSNVEVYQVKKLATTIGGQFALSFSREVTHVIVKTVSEKVRYCDRTLKYFLGIANKSWILSYKWVQESLAEKRLLREDEYEIIGDSVNGFAHRGPTRSRLSQTPLFKQFEIYVVGESSELPQDELKSLVKMAGGSVVTDPEEFCSDPGITCLAIAGSNQRLKDFQRLKGQMKIYNILLVSREWILDSVAMFRVQPLEGYIQLS